VLLGLSTGQKVGLLIAAGIFIVFALAASFLFPRRNPDFPGHRLGSFIALTVVLFLGAMTAVFVLAKEDEAEAEAHDGAVATETLEEGEEGPAGTTAETPTETGETGQQPAGDAAAGKEVFASAGCGGCHVLEDAGTSGAVGPNLDESQPSHELVVDRVTNGQGAMPAFGDQLSDEEIQNVAAYVVEATGGS
jgi:mono/diheme cytochrome c family protein